MAPTATTVQLKQQTVQDFNDYIREAEVAMENNLRGGGLFLWSDASSERAQ